MSYMYTAPPSIVCMSPPEEGYTEHSFPLSLLPAGKSKFLTDGLPLTVLLANESGGKDGVIALNTPHTAIYTVKDTSAASAGGEGRGDGTASYKAAELDCEGGAIVQVPEHISIGDRIQVDIGKKTYMRKAKPDEA